MNVALIFAGGTGVRMNARAKPKQFLELFGKPVIVYTIEVFENHPEIDKIIVVCVENYINELKKLVARYELRKVFSIIKGGSSAFHSIFNGLTSLETVCSDDDIVLIHDGVRPLIDEPLISANIECAQKHENAVSVVPAMEGVIISNDGYIVDDFPDRKLMYISKAPQTFRFRVICDLYKKSINDEFTPIEPAHLCKHNGVPMHIVMSSYSNIKITTPTDYYIFKAIHEANENSQIAGY